MIASRGNSLRALPDDDGATAAEQMHVRPNTVRYRLQQIATRTGHDPRTFAGLVHLICILETTDEQA